MNLEHVAVYVFLDRKVERTTDCCNDLRSDDRCNSGVAHLFLLGVLTPTCSFWWSVSSVTVFSLSWVQLTFSSCPASPAALVVDWSSTTSCFLLLSRTWINTRDCTEWWKLFEGWLWVLIRVFGCGVVWGSYPCQCRRRPSAPTGKQSSVLPDVTDTSVEVLTRLSPTVNIC